MVIVVVAAEEAVVAAVVVVMLDQEIGTVQGTVFGVAIIRASVL